MKRIFFNMPNQYGIFLQLAMASLLITSISSCSTADQHPASATEFHEKQPASVSQSVVWINDSLILVEGDMVMKVSQNTDKSTLAKSSSVDVAALFASSTKAWNKGEVIEFYFNPSQQPTQYERNEILRAMDNITDGVNISFKEISAPAIGQKPSSVKISIYDGDIPVCAGASGCAFLGKLYQYDGFASYSRSNYGAYYGTFAHELTHVLGMSHEHQRNDRSAYITVTCPPTQSAAECNENNGIKQGDYLGTNLDYASIMMYDTYNGVHSGNSTVDSWLGNFPVQSRNDKLALASKYGSKPKTEKRHFIRHKHSTSSAGTKTNYLCLNSNYDVVIRGNRTEANGDICRFEIMNSYASLESTNGIYSVKWNGGIRVKDNLGQYRYLQYHNNGYFYMRTLGDPSLAQDWVAWGNDFCGKAISNDITFACGVNLLDPSFNHIALINGSLRLVSQNQVSPYFDQNSQVNVYWDPRTNLIPLPTESYWEFYPAN